MSDSVSGAENGEEKLDTFCIRNEKTIKYYSRKPTVIWEILSIKRTATTMN